MGTPHELADLRAQLQAALEAGQRSELRARTLLGLVHALSSCDGDEAVAHQVAAALPGIVGSERASVLRWDAATGELRAVATAGLSDQEHTALLGSRLRPHETPELVEMLARREPTVLDPASATPVIRELMAAVGATRVIVVPLLASDTLLGVATVGWSPQYPAFDATLEDEIVMRLQGVADLAAAALHNAHLLAAVRHRSDHDALTGLPNRTAFTRQLDRILRGDGPADAVAVVVCDLDRFRGVNDAVGHAAGDELLRQVAARIRLVVPPTGLLARLSGDEFAIAATVPVAADASALAGHVVSCFEEPFRIEGRDLRATTSVGVALHRGPGGDGDRLLRGADRAMYAAKQRGRNQIVAAEDAPNAVASGSIGEELRSAIDGDQLRLRYQPIVSLGSAGRGVGEAARHAIGAEVLVRWEHPRLGLLSPAAFLPLAVEQGLVVDLDLWVLRAASGRSPASPRVSRPSTRTRIRRTSP